METTIMGYIGKPSALESENYTRFFKVRSPFDVHIEPAVFAMVGRFRVEGRV